MTTPPITRADSAAAEKWFREWSDSRGERKALVKAFALHRINTLEEVERACRATQYSPAPYTDTMSAILKLKGETK